MPNTSSTNTIPSFKRFAGRRFAIFDLDGCLIDDEWRLPRIDWVNRKFDSYHDGIPSDIHTLPIGFQALTMAKHMNIAIIFFTARPASHHKQTIEQLEDMLGMGGEEYIIFMRSLEEERIPSPDLKIKFWDALRTAYGFEKQHCVGAFDDHYGVVEAYRANGLPGFVCNKTQLINGSSDLFKGLQNGGVANSIFHNPIKNITSWVNGSDYEHPVQSEYLRGIETRLAKLYGRETGNVDRSTSKPRNHGAGPRNAVADEVKFAAKLTEATAERCMRAGKVGSSSVGFDPAFLPAAEESKETTITSRRLPTQTAADILGEASDTFRERNGMYKDNAFIHSKIMAAMFPEGVTLKTEEDYHMWHLFELIIVKLSRFANSGLKHQDSIRDLAVYAAMCETLVDCHDIFENKS